MNLMPPKPLIALLTDFGHEDPFVGIMKGVISNLSPQSRIIDITHSIPQGDIQRAAIGLWMASSYFPIGTVFLCVVDPGVGTDRKAIIIKDEKYTYIGPDNGIFSFVIDGKYAAWELSNPGLQLTQPGSTFHGRDIFAPAAAHASNGFPGAEFGPSIHDVVRLRNPNLQIGSGRIYGEIIYRDQYGNLLTSLGRFKKSGGKKYTLDPWLDSSSDLSGKLIIPQDQATLELPNGRILSWVKTFAEISTGECGFLVGSTGLIEIAAFNRSAQELTKLSLGDPVILLF